MTQHDMLLRHVSRVIEDQTAGAEPRARPCGPRGRLARTDRDRVVDEMRWGTLSGRISHGLSETLQPCNCTKNESHAQPLTRRLEGCPLACSSLHSSVSHVTTSHIIECCLPLLSPQAQLPSTLSSKLHSLPLSPKRPF